MESFWHVVTNDSMTKYYYYYYYGFVYHVVLHSLLASKGKAVFTYYHLSPVPCELYKDRQTNDRCLAVELACPSFG